MERMVYTGGRRLRVQVMKIRDTRYPELGYASPLGKVWRFVDKSTGRGIGPFYTTKAELLADLERFAAVFGADKPTAEAESVEPASWKR